MTRPKTKDLAQTFTIVDFQRLAGMLCQWLITYTTHVVGQMFAMLSLMLHFQHFLQMTSFMCAQAKLDSNGPHN